MAPEHVGVCGRGLEAGGEAESQVLGPLSRGEAWLLGGAQGLCAGWEGRAVSVWAVGRGWEAGGPPGTLPSREGVG